MLNNFKIKVAFYLPSMKVILAQCRKLKQYQKESKTHFESYYPGTSRVKISKRISVEVAKCSQKINMQKQTGTNNPVKFHLYWRCAHSISEASGTISAGGVEGGVAPKGAYPFSEFM